MPLSQAQTKVRKISGVIIATPRNQTFRQYQQLRAARRSITRKSVNNLQIPFRLLRHRKLRNRDGQMTTIFA